MTDRKELIETALKTLDAAEDAVEAMVDGLSYGEPELFGSKAMKYFFENLKDLIQNGRYFIFEEQENRQ